MTSLNLGPFAVPMQHMLLYLGFFGALAAGWLAGRKRQANPEGTLFIMLVSGLLVARLAFALRYWEQYAPRSLDLVDIRDGGFLLWPGLATAAVLGGVLAWRRPLLRQPLAVALLAGACVWGGGQAVNSALEQSRQLPQLSLMDLQGRPVALSELDGRPLVVNLWATWCPPCRREMPVLEAAQKAHPEVRFLLVNQGEHAEAVARYLREQGLTLPDVLLDSGNRLGQATGSYGLPTTLFYDPSGRLQLSHMGELSNASLAHGLQQLSESAAR